jgi:tetratricopeptide (TPR) repeat protein
VAVKVAHRLKISVTEGDPVDQKSRLPIPTEGTVTRASLREYAAVQRERYQHATRAEKHQLLDELVTVTGMHRKAAIRLLRRAVASSAWMLAALGQASEALSRLREGEQLVERQTASGVVGTGGLDYQHLGRACLLLGRIDEARRLGYRAVEFSARQPGRAARTLHLLGDIATHPDRFDAESGEAYYRKALALAEDRGMRPLVSHCHLGLGKLSRRTGKREQAQEHLTTATTMYREMGMTYWLEKAEAEMND